MNSNSRTKRAIVTTPRAHATFGATTAAFLLSRGWTMNKINEVCGVTGLQLVNPNERLPDDVLPRLWHAVWKETPDEALTLKMARATPFSVFAGLAEGMQFARNLEEALSLLAKNRVLLADRLEVALVEVDGAVMLQGTHPSDAIDEGRTSELAAALIVRLVREVLKVEDAVKGISLQYAAWGPKQAYHECFEVPVTFEQAEPGIIFHADKMKAGISHANAEMFSYVDEHFSQAIKHIMAAGYPAQLSKLRSAIADNASIGVFDGRAAAEKAYMSLRSAQRLAASYQLTLNQLIDEVRAEFAEELLGDPEFSIAQVAQLVGYSDDRAFRRAFKRWTKQTPSYFRRSRGIE